MLNDLLSYSEVDKASTPLGLRALGLEMQASLAMPSVAPVTSLSVFFPLLSGEDKTVSSPCGLVLDR